MIIPDDTVQSSGHVFGGEYNVDLYLHPAPTILDIGANIGAFSRWAGRHRWPQSTIHAYEPSNNCYDLLLENTKDLPNVHCHRSAVGASSGKSFLYHGLHNRGMSSMLKSEYTRETGSEIDVIAASELPYAEIVKCDTEGMEAEILTNLSFTPDVVLVEYHSPRARIELEKFYAKDFQLYESRMLDVNAGLLKFIRTYAVTM